MTVPSNGVKDGYEHKIYKHEGRGVHRSRTGPDRPGPKTEMGEGCGPRTRPVLDRSWTGPIKGQSFV